MEMPAQGRSFWVRRFLSDSTWKGAAIRYGFAVLAVAAAGCFRSLLTPVLAEEALTIFFTLAIIGVSALGGVGPGLFAVVLSMLVVDLLLTMPPWQWSIIIETEPFLRFRVVQLKEAIQVGMLAVTGTSIAFIVESLHRTRRKIDDQMIALTESEWRFRRAILEAPMPVMIHAQDGEVLHVSRAWTQISGYAAEEIPTTAEWTRRAYPDPSESIDRMIENLTVGEQTYRNAWELPVRTRDGQERMWVFSSAPLGELPDGRRLRITAAMDVTERRQTERQLEELNENLEQRVAERTAVAERQAAELRHLAFELTRTEQRERRRLARVLHDHLQQLLVAAKLNTAFFLHQLPKDADQQLLKQNEALLDEAIEASRSLAVELSPPVLYEKGLSGALEWLARWMQKKHGLSVELHWEHTTEPEAEEMRVLVFEIVRELLFNVVKHARVDRAEICLGHPGEGCLEVGVKDSGAGFVPPAADAAEGAGTGFGLLGIRRRLEVLGGRLEIDSAPGMGTNIRLTVPLIRPHAESPNAGADCNERVMSTCPSPP